jgi:hypothetical protein
VGVVATPSIAMKESHEGNGPKSWNYKIDTNSTKLASLIEQRTEILASTRWCPVCRMAVLKNEKW